MSRLVWVALGAAGGVYAYRRGQRLLEEARERGVVGSVQAATGSATSLATAARGLLAGTASAPPTSARSGRPASDASPGPTGAAAAKVLAESQSKLRAERPGDR